MKEYMTVAVMLAMATAPILDIGLAIKTDCGRLAKTWTEISHSTPILAGSMTTEITVTGENMVTRIAIGRSTPAAIEMAMNLLFAGTRIFPYGEDI
jgi:hypothetical protein